MLLLGARTLAMISEAAWTTGGGKPTLLQRPPDRNGIQTRYIDNDFLPSRVLDDIAEFLT